MVRGALPIVQEKVTRAGKNAARHWGKITLVVVLILVIIGGAGLFQSKMEVQDEEEE